MFVESEARLLLIIGCDSNYLSSETPFPLPNAITISQNLRFYLLYIFILYINARNLNILLDCEKVQKSRNGVLMPPHSSCDETSIKLH